MTAQPIPRATRVPSGALKATEARLRPLRLADIVGQPDAIEVLEKAIAGAKADGRMPAPILLMGPPGTGKTTIANAIAHELGGRLTELFGVSLRYPRDVTIPLELTIARDVLIIDEIHRVSRPVQEILYTVMEDGRVSTGSRSWASMQTLPPMTIVGATTDPERLTEPMLDRFRLKVRLQPYDLDGLTLIASRTAVALGVGITDAAARLIAETVMADAGAPRVVINLVWAARDWAQPITDDPSPHAKWFGTTPADAPINLAVHTLPPMNDYRGAWRDNAADERTDAEHADLAEHAVPGTRWVTTASVKQLIDSPALVWRIDGRDAG